jgi:short-subunit dehydrogenase
VTGASRGIGRALARQIVDHGGYVGAIARDERALDELTRADHSGRTRAAIADVSDRTALGSAIDELAAWKGRIDGLVVNAATIERGEFASIPPQRIESIVGVNLTGALLAVRHTLPYLSGGARIVLVGSFAARRGTPGLAVYSATKGALLSFCAAVRAELADRGISVSWVAPGPTQTELHGEDPAAAAPETSARLVLRALRSGEPYVEATSCWRTKALLESLAPRLYDRWVRFKLRRTP